MAIGRRELGAILLGVAAIVFYLVLLSTTPSGAQTGGGTTNTTIQNITQGPFTTSRTTNQTPNQTSNRTTSATAQSKGGGPKEKVVNIPDRPLPPSGGLPVYGVVAGFVLAGTGLLALGLGIRRGPQR